LKTYGRISSKKPAIGLKMNRKTKSRIMLKFSKKQSTAGLLLMLVLILALCGCFESPLSSPDTTVLTQATSAATSLASSGSGASLVKGKAYSAPDDVAAYLHLYQQLPPNYITKLEAARLGWDSSKGNLWELSDHKSIGGDHFGNREGKLPQADDREWFECDVNYFGGFRGAERLVYSSDGLIYYTADHYQTFTRLY
jgi:ribonuclease T1